MITSLISEGLVAKVRQHPAVFPCERQVGRKLVHEIAHVVLVVPTVSDRKFRGSRRIDSIPQIHLPLLGEVELSLYPSTLAPDSVAAGGSNCAHRFSVGD